MPQTVVRPLADSRPRGADLFSHQTGLQAQNAHCIFVDSNVRFVGQAFIDVRKSHVGVDARIQSGCFSALAHPTRVAIMEFLSYGEMSVGRLCEKIGVEQANASQHLAVLRNKHLVETRKDGNQIFYRLRDPLLGDVLEAMRKFFLSHITEALESLKTEKKRQKRTNSGRRPDNEWKSHAETGGSV